VATLVSPELLAAIPVSPELLEVTQANLELPVATLVSPEPQVAILDSPVTHLNSPAILPLLEVVSKDTTLECKLSSLDILQTLIIPTPPSPVTDNSRPTDNNRLTDNNQLTDSSKPMASPSKGSATAMPVTQWIG